MTGNGETPVAVVLSAIGGYGYYYLKTIFEEIPSDKIKIAGVVDPQAENSGYFAEIKKLNISVYNEMEDFYRDGNTADLAVISSPIHYHVPQSCIALKNGTNVLCDKPLGAAVQEADELIRISEQSGKWVMIGYQWSYSEAIQNLKKDILSGIFGKPVRLKILCLWGRDDAYYQRNNWAGRMKSDDGRWILDSPVNNAMAHFMHNMFFVIGDEKDTSAVPVSVTAECSRANKIENYDTVSCRALTDSGTEMLFYGSHAAETEQNPVFQYEFENAVITLGEDVSGIIAVDRKGNSIRYGSPDDDHQFRKLFIAVENIRRQPPEIACGPRAARSQTLCINGIQESIRKIGVFPDDIIVRNNTEKRYFVTDLDSDLINCYHKGLLPSECGIRWAQPGTKTDLTNYRFFPGGSEPGQFT
ncbi:Gfo/Idh/MocA family protein [candidate division KSB1 bacterium]